MSWFRTTFRSSLIALFRTSTAPPRAEQHEVTADEIRAAMTALAETASAPYAERAASLARRIRYASDVQSLWFMRSELMGLLARSHGEAAARAQIVQLSALFDGLLPRGLRVRASPLDGSGHSGFSLPPSVPQSDFDARR